MILKGRWLLLLKCTVAVVMTASTAMSMGRVREAPLAVTVLAAGRQCQVSQEGWRATWIQSPEALREMLGRCRTHRLGAVSGDLPDVDFEHFGVLAVEMGARPSAGYGFDTESVTAQTAGETATVKLTHVQPAPGAMAAQVMTSPWILIQLRVANFREIHVVDQTGVVLAQIKRP